VRAISAKYRTVLVTLAVAATFTAVGQAEAGQARIFADQDTANVLGDRGITPDVAAPAELTLSPQGRALATFPTFKSKGVTRLKGALTLRRGIKLVSIRGLRLDGRHLSGQLGGKSRKVLFLAGSRKSGNKVTFKAGKLTATAARILRQTFTDSVFKSGLRIFEDGRIALS
jgi:hypothetical protein